MINQFITEELNREGGLIREDQLIRERRHVRLKKGRVKDD